MSNKMIQTDKAIEILFEELTQLKSTSQRLTDAEQSIDHAISSSKKVTELSNQLLKNSTKQLEAVATLTSTAEEKLNLVTAEQKSFASATAEHGLQQINAIHQFISKTEERIDSQITEQKTFATQIQRLVELEMQSHLAQIHQLEIDTEGRFNTLVVEQQTVATQIQKNIIAELQSNLIQYQSSAAKNRLLLTLMLIVSIANLVLIIWSVIVPKIIR